MRRVRTPVARRLAARAHTAAAVSALGAGTQARSQSSSSSPAAAVPALRIRSRGYGPSSDLLRGLPEHVALHVEATLHPEDAEIQRAILALAMPSLAEVHVTPVVPHDSYSNKVPATTATTATAAAAGDVMSRTEREVMEECLQAQLADVANLVVQQVSVRTGQQLDALQVTHDDALRNFAEILLHTIQDEVRQLRVSRRSSPTSAAATPSSLSVPPAESAGGAAAASPALDVEAVARVVSARVMEQLGPLVSAAPSRGSTDAVAPPPQESATTEATTRILADLEKRTAAYFDALQTRVQSAVVGSPASPSAPSADGHAAPAVIAEISAAVSEAVERASATQQEQLANLVNDWLADMPHASEVAMGSHNSNRTGSSSSGSGDVNMKALEEMVETAVQTSTDELRHIITAEVKKLTKGRSGKGGRGDDDGDVDTTQLVGEVERVFDLVSSTQSRLVAVDEAVGDVVKEQASTREALQHLQTLLEQHLRHTQEASTPALTSQPPTETTTNTNTTTTTSHVDAETVRAVEAAVERLRHEVAATSAQLTLQQDESQQQLLTVAQVVSDSVAAAVQQHTTEAVQAAMATVQHQLEAMTATAAAAAAAAAKTQASAEASKPDGAAEDDKESRKTESKEDHATSPVAAAASSEVLQAPPAPLSREVVAEAVEAVLTPRWSELAAGVERLQEANQQAIEQQLLHMANSVAASVTASVQEQIDAALTRHENTITASAAAAAEAASAAAQSATADEHAEATRTREEAQVAAAATAAASELAAKTSAELSSLRTELVSTLQAELHKSQGAVDLTPMYKYIDSVLTFMKEELHLQETSLTAKMTALAEGVTAAVEQSATQPTAARAESEGESKEKENAINATPATSKDSDVEGSSSSSSTKAETTAAPVTVAIPDSLTQSVEAQAAALRRLEERLNEATLHQSRDASLLLTQLQSATEDFRAATAATTAASAKTALATAAQPHPDQLAWQADTTRQLAAMGDAMAQRDAELLAAVQATATGAEMKTQLESVAQSLRTASAEDRAELEAALRSLLEGSAQEQAGRVDTLMQRVAEMQRALQDQAVAVQLLQPPLALADLTAEQREAQARIRTASQDHLRRIIALMEALPASTSSEKSQHGASAEVAAKLRVELEGLRALQDEESTLQRQIANGTPTNGEAAGSSGGAAATTVTSIVQAEVSKARTDLQTRMDALSAQHDAAHSAVVASISSLLARLEDIHSSTSAAPAIADIQQLLDATMLQLADRQKEDGVHVTQLVAEATQTTAKSMQAVVETTLAASVTSAVEQRVLPHLHDSVEEVVQRELTAQTAAVKTAVDGVASHTSAAVSQVEALVRDLNSQRAEESRAMSTQHQSALESLHSHRASTTRVPLWWMLANALLVGVVVLLSMYYVLACLLLAFVPMPGEKEKEKAGTPPPAEERREPVDQVTDQEVKQRRGSRYVDRYM